MRSLWRRLTASLGGRARGWALRRQGRDPVFVTLESRRIYILPTPAGLVFGLLVLTMLAGAMNYNNNLGFALAFLLASLGVTVIYHTHRTLAGLRLRLLGAEPVFAGDPLDVRLTLVNEAATPREEVFLDWPGSPPVPAGLGPLDSRLVRLPLETRRRGARPLPGLRVGTRAPLGLMHAWAWVHIDAQLLVWPRPAAGPVPLPNSTGSHRPHDGHQRPGDEDFAGLRSYRRGDSPRRIAWKSYARCGELLVRDFRGGGPAAILWLDWNTLPPGDVEQRVAWLTRQVLDAAAGDRPWGLRVPGITVEPAQGREHLRRCLEQLAVVAPEALP